MFRKVDPKANLPKMEEKILRFWEEKKIFQKSIKSRKGKKQFTFYDGPPFATGLPHYGHILAMSIKDAITRYKTMQGFFVPRRNGWDCHGLPVEYEMEKTLGISGKKEIEKLGIKKFNQKCKSIVFRHIKEWTQTMKRIGRWVDFNKTYTTMDNDYIESVWWTFSQIYKKGLAFQGYKSMPYCPRCQTPLSNFEVNQGYAETEDPSIYTKIPIKDKKNEFLLVWTTTPWTLLGNVAVAVAYNVDYVKVKLDKEYFILAKERLNVLVSKKYKIIEEYKGKDLIGLEYKPLYTFIKPDKKSWYITSADFVSTEEGTGLVHIAPAFGEDDLNLGQKVGLSIIQPVGLNGCFIEKTGPYSGMFVKDADLKIIKELTRRGLMFKAEKISHTYPFCWRCDSPLLYYAMTTWFINVPKVKRNLVINNKQIHWMPNHIGKGRFGKWLEGAKEWAVSRNRYWGAPLPLWQCQKCGHIECIGSINELAKKSQSKNPREIKKLDLHRPYIDKIKLTCLKCGGSAKRIEEVFDCWFESGSMPYAQWHYPFEDKKIFEEGFPADFIAEGLDQTRGWFYTLHVISTILYNKPAFYNVIVNGILLSSDGKKLSKRLKNYPEPEEVFSSFGVDSLRYFMFTSTMPFAESARFSSEHVQKIAQRFTMTLWNTYSFFITYAQIDKFDPNKKPKIKNKSLLDRWIISRLNDLIEEVTKYLDDYNLTKSSRPISNFVDDLSNWFIRRSRRRFWKSENDEDKQAAHCTLYEVLITLSKLLAPFTPFISEEIYQNLVYSVDKKAPESVHLCDYPKADKKLINRKLNQQMDNVRKIVEAALAERAEAKIKVRQPLSSCRVYGIKKLNKELTNLIIDEINVKELEFTSGKELRVKLDNKLTLELKQEGIARDIVRIIQQMRKKADFNISDRIVTFYYTSCKEMLSAIEKYSDYIKKETLSSDLILKKEKKVDTQNERELDKRGIWIGLKK